MKRADSSVAVPVRHSKAQVNFDVTLLRRHSYYTRDSRISLQMNRILLQLL
jgi:hypothetical protein